MKSLPSLLQMSACWMLLLVPPFPVLLLSVPLLAAVGFLPQWRYVPSMLLMDLPCCYGAHVMHACLHKFALTANPYSLS